VDSKKIHTAELQDLLLGNKRGVNEMGTTYSKKLGYKKGK
jgi:hypothetical protein